MFLQCSFSLFHSLSLHVSSHHDVDVLMIISLFVRWEDNTSTIIIIIIKYSINILYFVKFGYCVSLAADEHNFPYTCRFQFNFHHSTISQRSSTISCVYTLKPY